MERRAFARSFAGCSSGGWALRWYAVALLPAPLLAAAVLLSRSRSEFSRYSPRTTRLPFCCPVSRRGLRRVLEELGWTGFAVPRLRRRYGVLTTGLIVGVLWGAWHFLQGLFMSGTYSGALPLALFVPMNFFAAVAQLTAYRVLMVWVYDRTGSLLVVMLMHASLTASTIFIFTPLATGVSFLTYVGIGCRAVGGRCSGRRGLTRRSLPLPATAAEARGLKGVNSPVVQQTHDSSDRHHRS